MGVSVVVDSVEAMDSGAGVDFWWREEGMVVLSWREWENELKREWIETFGEVISRLEFWASEKVAAEGRNDAVM